MKFLRKVIIMITILGIINNTLTGAISTNLNVNGDDPVRVAVFLYSFKDYYMSTVKKTLEDIQMNNKDKVEFTFYDGQNNEASQNAEINNTLQISNVDILLVDLVNRGSAESVKNIIGKAKALNIPVVFTYINPKIENIIKSYTKSLVISPVVEQMTYQQGNIIVDIWNTNKTSIDKNNDNILQYIILHGPSSANPNTTSSNILAINAAGIKTEQLASINANYNEELAKNAISSLFLQYYGSIEAILSDTDSMAIGAVKALQKYGYNTGIPSKTVVVVGMNGLPEARELIDKGFMTGTIIQDPSDTAQALYTVGMNLYNKEDPLKGTDYKLDSTGVKVLLPYKIYKTE